MRILLIVFFFLIYGSAFALECPNESKKTLYDDGQGNYSFEFSCDDGVTVRAIHMNQETSDEQLIEMTTGKKCISHEDLIICR